MDIIEPSESSFSSPIVMVRKKDETFRFCIDLRALNRITLFDSEPMPCIDDMFSKLSGTNISPGSSCRKVTGKYLYLHLQNPKQHFGHTKVCFSSKLWLLG